MPRSAVRAAQRRVPGSLRNHFTHRLLVFFGLILVCYGEKNPICRIDTGHSVGAMPRTGIEKTRHPSPDSAASVGHAATRPATIHRYNTKG